MPLRQRRQDGDAPNCCEHEALKCCDLRRRVLRVASFARRAITPDSAGSRAQTAHARRQRGAACIRLNFSLLHEDQIEEGIARLARVIKGWVIGPVRRSNGVRIHFGKLSSLSSVKLR